MTERLTSRESMTPGSRTRVTLEIAELSLPVLLEGIDVDRCWLTEEGDGVYGFHATQALGETRKQPGTPAIDLLIGLLGEFADYLDAEDVPEWLRKKWDEMVDSYKAQTAKPTG